MPLAGWRPGKPNEEPEPPAADDLTEDVLSGEQIAIIHARWRNLTDPVEKGGGGFTPEEAFELCGNPRLDWHFAKYLRARGCPFETILELTS